MREEDHEKILEMAEIWSKKEMITLEDKDVDWIRMNRVVVKPEFYQVFVNATDKKFNWLLRLWGFINL